MTYDLNDIFIPEEVQRMIPYFVKGELYEEDEPAMAQTAYAMYINFLRGLKRPFNKVQTKVRRSQVFTKRIIRGWCHVNKEKKFFLLKTSEG